MNNILISGSTGFIGRNLEEYFKHLDYNVEKLGRNENALFQKTKFSWDNLLGLKNCNFNAYIHLAGKAHDLRKSTNDKEYFDVNYGLTKSLFDIFIQSDVQDFVYFSSVKAVADTLNGVLTEETDPNPKTPYGQSKFKAEQYILSKKLSDGKRVFILRPCMVHGPGNKGNLNLLYKIVNKGIPYPLGAFHNQRSFLSISNLNCILKQLLSDRTIPGGVYNLADDISLSTNEVIKIIARADNRTPRLWRVNSGLIKAIALVGDKLHLPLNSERLKKLTESYVVSNEKIKRALNIEKLPTSSEDGLLRTIKSFHSK